MDVGGFGMIEATDAGLREGVFFETLLGDPPLVDDVRRATVCNLAAQYDADFAHVEHVATLALELWDALAAAGLHRGDPKERELLWATAMLHDIGTAVDYDDHHKHSRYLILSAGMPGYSPREVALIGQAARYHRKGNPGLGEFAALARPGDEALLNRIAAAVRIAEQLERSRDQAVHACDVRGHQRPRRAAAARRRGRHDRPLGDRASGRRVPQGVRPRPQRQLTARRELVADLERDRQAELLELAHVALERRGLAAEGRREVGRALARVVGDRLQVLVGPLAHPLELGEHGLVRRELAQRDPRVRPGQVQGDPVEVALALREGVEQVLRVAVARGPRVLVRRLA